MERGYGIEDERAVPVNGLCSFIAIRDMPQDEMSALVQQALIAEAELQR